jgi:hypothetical protein
MSRADFHSPATKKNHWHGFFFPGDGKKKKHRPLFLIITNDKTELLRVVAIE